MHTTTKEDNMQRQKKEKLVRTVVYLLPELNEQLRQLSLTTGESMSAIIAKAVEAALENQTLT
jgi:predicted DNA-binding protein